LLAGAIAAPPAAAESPSSVTPFSTAMPGAVLPAPWRLTLLPGVKRPTRYSLVRDEGTMGLRADAEASMASVVHPLHLDASRLPLVSWRWKASNTLRKADINTRAGDDYAARVYVLFDYDTARLPLLKRMKLALARKRYGADMPAAALCYVWDAKAAVGTSTWSAYTDRVRMVVVESGATNLGRWREVERNVQADFRAAFGEEPPAISGVAVVTDTDNTGESASTLFGDIRFRPATRSQQ